MSKTWTFIGGMLAGVASVFAAAAASIALDELEESDAVIRHSNDDGTLTDVETEEDTNESEAETA